VSAVEITQVSKSFGAVEVLRSVDLDVPAGQRTVIVGSSGSGKTTLLRLVSGFELPSAGTISVGGRLVAGGGAAVPAHRRGIGHVAQDGALFPHLTVGQNIAFGLGSGTRGRARSTRIDELLEMVSLASGYAARRPDELSGGEQQRVALARALARSPRTMLLDEPFSALDAGLREATRKVVAETLERAGVTTVLVTHDRAEALSFADQLAVLREGRLVQVGAPRDLYARPVDLFTATFLGDAVILDGLLEGGRARCALGEVDVPAAGHDGPVRLMLRPEQLRVQPSDGPGVGRVTALDFRGGSTTVSVELDVHPGGRAAQGPLEIRQAGDVAMPVGSRVDITCLAPAAAYPLQGTAAQDRTALAAERLA
jgi:iron(III) transport system ATP-binding protein